MEDNEISNASPSLESRIQEMDIVKKKPFVLVFRITDKVTNEPLIHKRIVLEINIQAVSAPGINLPNLLRPDGSDDYRKQLTDEKGFLIRTFVVDDVSRKYDPQGLIIVANISGTEQTCKSGAFKVLSKRKRTDGLEPNPSKRTKQLLDKILALEQRVINLESQNRPE
jgi:hypothetical protein